MSSTQPWKMDDAGGDDAQMPLGVGGEVGGEETYGGESKPKVNTSTMALFAAFAAALVVLYLLGLQNKPRQASAEDLAKQAAVTSAIDDMLQHTDKGAKIDKLLSDTGRLVQLLMGALGNKGVEIGELPGNPFERVIAAAPVRGDEPEVILPPNRSEQERLRLMAEEFGKLKVQMVITGSRPAAMINNQLVTLGAAVGEYFKVSEIQPNRVVLSSGGKSFVLKVDAPKGKQ
jgi:hypothetical protein